MPGPLQVEVMAADGKVWEGQAINVIARTTEGDIGILADHEPVMAALVPCAAEITTPDGTTQLIALSDGFISVFRNRVSLLSAFGELAEEIPADQARSIIANLHDRVDAGEASHQELRDYNHAVAQLRTAMKYEARSKGHEVNEITPQPAHISSGN